LLIEVDPAIINDRTLAQLNRSDQRRYLDVHIRVRGQGEADPQQASLPDTALPSQDIVGIASTVIARLGLSARSLETRATKLLENAVRWHAEEALLALTIIFKNVRVIVGLMDSRSLPDQSTWERLKARIQKEGIREYTLGVFLIPPASPPDDPAQWKQDGETQDYTDIPLGDISQPELEKSEHWVLQ
jgi:hypothetical protein